MSDQANDMASTKDELRKANERAKQVSFTFFEVMVTQMTTRESLHCHIDMIHTQRRTGALFLGTYRSNISPTTEEVRHSFHVNQLTIV